MLSPAAQLQHYPDFSKNTLYVITSVFNAPRFESRYRLYEDFAKYVNKQPNTHLVTIECAYGHRDYAFKDRKYGTHIGVRTNSELWVKECCLNLAVQRLPESADYLAFVDADVRFAREDWALETIHQLQHHKVVQMFSTATDLNAQHEAIHHYKGFAYNYEMGGHVESEYEPYYTFRGHPGYTMAMRKDTYSKLGGLIETGIAGAGDHHAWLALVNLAERSFPGNCPEAYKVPVLAWQERAQRIVNQSIGYVPGELYHQFHGPKRSRAYQSRWSIVVDNDFNPFIDLIRNCYGVFDLSGNKPKLREDLRQYALSRNEDDTCAL